MNEDRRNNDEQCMAEFSEMQARIESLQREQRRLASILDEMPVQVYIIDPDYSFRYTNRMFREHFGDPGGKACYMVFHGRTEPCENCASFRPGVNRQCRQTEYNYPSGSSFRNYQHSYVDVDGTETIFNFGLDITEQKKTEAALLQSEEKFSKAFHCNPDLMAISTVEEGLYLEVNEAFSEITGYQREEIYGRTAEELGIWANYEQRDHMMEMLRQQGRIRDYELDLRLKSGEIRTFSLAGEIFDIDGVQYLVNSSRDITENKRTLEALRFSEECFAKAFNASPIAMSISSLEEGLFIMVNNSFCNMMQLTPEELIEKTSLDIGIWTDKDQRSLLQNKLMAKQPVDGVEILFNRRNGEQGWGLYSAEELDLNGEACILSALLDITKIRKMEAEMDRLERLNLVGEIAASIAHEIRNPMTTVRGYLQLLQHNQIYRPDSDKFDLMIEELDRANSIITEFLSLAKNKVVKLVPGNLNAIILKIMPLMRVEAFSRDQQIELELDSGLPDILLNDEEVRQLVFNLVNNGMEAMSAGGHLKIRTLDEGRDVIMAVQDQGHGIDNELMSKVGTPFFTTKENGTGLGLAVCYRIAARHHAKIDIESTPVGTAFYVRFPKEIIGLNL